MTALGQTRDSEQGHYWHFGKDNSLLQGCGCSVNCRIFSSISVLYPLDTSSSPFPPLGLPKNVSRCCQITPWGERGIRSWLKTTEVDKQTKSTEQKTQKQATHVYIETQCVSEVELKYTEVDIECSISGHLVIHMEKIILHRYLTSIYKQF